MQNPDHNSPVNKLLKDITHNLLINTEFSSDSGLFYGKLGAALFYYKLSKYYRNDLFYNRANNLILDIISSDNQQHFDSVYPYSRGLAGIATTLSFLTKKKIIDVPIDFFSQYIIPNLIKTVNFDGLISEVSPTLVFLMNESYKMHNNINDEQLEHLVIQDKLIDRLNLISSTHQSHRVLPLVDFKEDLLRDRIISKLTALTDDLSNTFYLLSNVTKHKVSDYLSKPLWSFYKINLNLMLDNLFIIVEEEHDFYCSNKWLVMNILCKLYAVDSKRTLYGSQTTRFEKCLSNFARQYKQKAINDNSLKHLISCISILTRLKNYDGNIGGQNVVQLALSEFTTAIDSKRHLTNLFSYGESLNIGTKGLSGLGLTLLQLKNLGYTDILKNRLI